MPKWRPVTGTSRSPFHIPSENVLLTGSIASYRLHETLGEWSADAREFEMECFLLFWNLKERRSRTRLIAVFLGLKRREEGNND
ncbi:hypothetical protein JTE90_015404 [Oedothorax gibbosus]|uniref:Uncharacterized protein n=1 Tax=Oedothorax gibbosus TaxID=931172 RepID=A0AAV6U6Y7_9ARAC|nr:hypothetical protein JTE90_015404 [Oedothorax gibbosus]